MTKIKKILFVDCENIGINEIRTIVFPVFKKRLDLNLYNKIEFVIPNTVKNIDELFYSYILLFAKEFSRLKFEINSNSLSYELNNKIEINFNFISSIADNISSKNIKYEIQKEHNTFCPFLFINNETLNSIFKSNKYYSKSNENPFKLNAIKGLIYKNKEELIVELKSKFKIAINDNYKSSAFQYMLATLNDLNLLHIYYLDSTEIDLPENITYPNSNIKIDNQNLVKKQYKELCNNGFFEFNDCQIFIFRLIISSKELIEKDSIVPIIQFVKDITIGVHELAKNIVEHSANNNNGIGIISFRLFAKKGVLEANKFINIKYNETESFKKWNSDSQAEYYLDINVIDNGRINVIDNYKNNLIAKVRNEIENEINTSIKNDIKKIELGDVSLINLFDYSKITFEHQTRKMIARFGLLTFSKKVLEKNGWIQISTSNPNQSISLFKFNSEIKSETSQTESLNIVGTSYSFIIPISDKLIAESKKTFPQSNFEPILSYDIGIYQQLLNYKYLNDKDKILDENHCIFETELTNIIQIEGIDKYKYVELYADQIINKNPKHIQVIDASKIDFAANASDWIRFLAYVQSLEKTFLIIYNIEESVYNDLVRLNRDSEVANFEFWNIEFSVLFYIKKSYHYINHDKLDIWFNSILIGETFEKFKCINNKISKYHFNINTLDENENIDSNLTNIDLSLNPFFFNNSLLNFELLIRIDESKLTLFEESIQSILNLSIENEELKNEENSFYRSFTGFKLSNSHFKLGSKLHIHDFYFAKRLFYNSFYTSRFAFIIARFFIDIGLKKNENYLLLGKGIYSDLLVNSIRLLLNNALYLGVKHDIILENSNLLKQVDNLNIENIILINPISSTFSTSKKMRDVVNIIKQNNKISNSTFFHFPDISVIEVLNEPIEDINWNNVIEERKSFLDVENNLSVSSNPYVVFNWEFKDEKLIVSTSEQKYFIPLYSKWELVYNCNKCFTNEECIHEVEVNDVTLDLTFGFPKINITFPYSSDLYDNLIYKENTGNQNELPLNQEIKSLIFSKLIEKDNVKYHFYTRMSKFIQKNKADIGLWLHDISKTFNKDKKLVIITPISIANSGFPLIVNQVCFNDNANIMVFNENDENIENFLLLNIDVFNNSEIFFVNDVILSAKSYYFIQNLLNKFNPDNPPRIKSYIALIHRMDYYSSLSLKEFMNSDESIHYFISLNLPALNYKKDLEHYENRIQIFNKLSKQSTLDLSRLNFNRKKRENSPTNIGIEGKKIPSELNGLFKALIYNAILNQFQFENKLYRNEKVLEFVKYKEFDAIFKLISDDVNIKKFVQNHCEFRSEIDINVIRSLSKYPLSHYKYLKEFAFSWTLNELKATSFFDNVIILVEEDKKYSTLDRIKLLLRIATNLNVNFIYSIEFIAKIKEFYSFNLDVDIYHKFTIYYTALIQELIYNDEAKAVVLVKNIRTILGESLSLRKVFSEPFINLLRILVFENNFVFDTIYDDFKQHITLNCNNLLEGIINTKNNPEIYSEFTNTIQNYLKSTNSEALKMLIGKYDLKDELFKKDKDLNPVFESMMYLRLWLDLEKKQKQINRDGKILKDNIKFILEYACKILDLKKGGAYLTVRYKRTNTAKEIASQDLFTIETYETAKDYILNEELNIDGNLVHEMFKGIKEEGNEYSRSIFEALRDHESNWEHNNVYEILNLENYQETNFKLEYDNLLLVRIGEVIVDENDNFEIYPNAVLTFYGLDIKDDEDKSRFSPKNVRFILLLRDAINDFIKHHLDNDSFSGYIEEERKNEFRAHLKHSVGKFTNFQEELYFAQKDYVFDRDQYIINCLEDLKIAKQNFELNNYTIHDKVFKIITNSIKGQTSTAYETNGKMDSYIDSIILKDIFNTIFMSDYFGRSIDLPLNLFSEINNFKLIKIPYVIRNVVIPEIIFNMKKYGIDYKFNYFEDELNYLLIFENNVKSKNDNPGFGLKMCKKICEYFDNICLEHNSRISINFQITLKIKR